jgi:phosphate transport system substrate-binding protein
MSVLRQRWLVGAGALALTGLGSLWLLLFSRAPSAEHLLRAQCLFGRGSTFADPIFRKWVKGYQARSAVAVDYAATGSGLGIEGLLDSRTDFACTELPLSADQLQRVDEVGGVVQIPILVTAVVPVYRLEGTSKPLRFSGSVLADIFLGRIRKWNDPALRALNAGVELPERPIVVLRRDDASATTWLFTRYLSRVSKRWQRAVGSGTAVNWPVGSGSRG